MKHTPMEVRLIDHMGSDLSVVNAARVSFAKTKTDFDPEKDDRLLKYLATHDHWSPFGHAFLSFRIKAPIFVARQLVKHQVGLCWNEVSRRYVSDEPEYYMPDEWRAAPTGGAKQGSSDGSHLEQQLAHERLRRVTEGADRAYRALIVQNVAPEMARMVLPQNMHTEWIWSGSLMAFARVCHLRLDAHAQVETAEIAKAIGRQCKHRFPHSWVALVDGGQA